MPETTTALHRALLLLLGMVAGLVPCALIVLAVGNGGSAGFEPLLAAAYVSFLVLAFIGAACLVRSAQRPLGAGIALGLLLTVAYYLSLFVRAAGSFA
jgi:hypothetical protein